MENAPDPGNAGVGKVISNIKMFNTNVCIAPLHSSKIYLIMKKFFSILTLCILTPLAVFSQHSIKGKVSDANGEPVVGTQISIKDTYKGTYADADGMYQLSNLSDGDYTIVVKFFGFEKQEVVVSISGADVEQNFTLVKSIKNLDEIVVLPLRIENDEPVAHENISKEDLEKNNHGVDIPVLLDQATSVVTTTDAGAGVGYTGIRVRGTDPTRINVTVNGIPLNDPESHGVWWVNMPDLASSTSDIQLQRGVGTSTNGAGAFGASINLNTLSGRNEAYGLLSNSFGSFNTMKNTAQFGSGLIDGKWIFEGRLSNVQSDGYMDRASSDLKSYYFSSGYYGEKSLLKFVTFAGHEKTYQAWYGVPLDSLSTNRTYNPYTYDNEIDNYQQKHYQLHYVYDINSNFKLNAAAHYTRGFGFFEQYKGANENAIINYWSKESLSDYGLDDIITAKGDTITETDLIRRRWLDNHFYGLVYSVEYSKNKLKAVLGGGINQYKGRHFGEVIWSEYASNGSIRHPYYDNDATKNDINIYAKANYDVTPRLNVFGDVQYRMVDYTFLGFDNNLNNITQNAKLSFFNPKAGANFRVNENQSAYAYYGIANKEPNRNDFTESTPNSRPRYETLNDVEFGYRFKSKNVFANVNVYSMDYKNQLITTGELNDVGAAVRVNVPTSYRRGVELTAGVKILNNLEWRANATFSQNKIAQFTEFIDDWDTGGQIEEIHNNTDIAFSPNLIAGSELVYSPLNSKKYGSVDVAFITKYVSDQFIDNTQSEFAKLDAYLINDARVQYTSKGKLFKEIVFSGWVRNLFNEQYVSNSWVYRFKSDWGTYGDAYGNTENEETGMYNLIGAFPQAGLNFFVGLTLKF